jgi:hypothetical protein
MTGEPMIPTAFGLPPGEWDCSLAATEDSVVRVSVLSGNCLTVYLRHDVSPGDHDYVTLGATGRSLRVVNRDSTFRNHSIEFIHDQPDSETVCTIAPSALAIGDSIGFEAVSDAVYQIDNFGDSTEYWFALEITGTHNSEDFESASLPLEPQTSHRVIVDQFPLGDSLMIVRDIGMENQFSDTIFVVNTLVAVTEQSEEGTLPQRFSLRQNRPNPFNAETVIEYAIPRSESVTLTILNTLGQTVRVFDPGHQPVGVHSLVWNGCDEQGREVSTGVYFYRLEAGNFTDTKKMLLLK